MAAAEAATKAATEAAVDQLQFTDSQFIWRFSPNQTDPKLLEAIFVGREPLMQNILEKVVESATTDSKHHILLYGPRGIGKSHFTTLLRNRLHSDVTLSKKIHIARLNEDETTTTVVQLLVRIYRALCFAYPNDYAAEWLDELLNHSPLEIADILTRRLVARFEKRTLVLLIENLNLMFENLGLEGQQSLRTLLQEHPFACVIATSQQLFKAVTDRSDPFFGFFQQIPLKPLSLLDAHDLLLKIARSKGQDDLVAFLNTPDGRSRVRAIHDLAGGNHRVYIVLSGFITRESLDQLVTPFKKMADDLTPYYQERLRSISAQQRQVVELLCRERGTLNPKEIARRLMVSEQTIGKQIHKLVEIGYLNATKRGRETFYDLSEPLMRLAYEVKEQSLLVMLIDFLRIWYGPEQMRQMRAAGLSHSTQAYMDAAIERSQTHPDPRLTILNAEIDRAEAEGRSHELAAMWEEKAVTSNNSIDWTTAGYHFGKINQQYLNALNCYDKALEINPKNADAWNSKGVSLHNIRRYSEALDCYHKALEIDPKDASAWNSKGHTLYILGRYSEALACLDKALEIDPKYSYAWIIKGYFLNNFGRYSEALDCYDKALEIDPKNAIAWSIKGLSLHILGRDSEALDCYDQALEIDPENVLTRSGHSEALFALQRWEEGFASIRTAIELSLGPETRLADTASMFSLIFRFSENEAQLQSRIDLLVDAYQTAFENQPERGENPLSWLGDGLVKSLTKLDATRVSSQVLESYVQAVERRVAKIPEFDVPLRLFRYGIRYLIHKDPAVFVELVQIERNILHQALRLDEKSHTN